MSKDLSLEIHSVLLEGEVPTYVHLLPSGVFSGQDGRGPYAVEDIDRLIAESLSEDPLVIDYDHQTDYAARPGVGVAAPAAGWIRDIEKRKDGIWGHVEWTSKAAHAIREGEYRYLSPVFLHDDDGKIIRILRAGLTNNPNLNLKALSSLAQKSANHRIAHHLNLSATEADDIQTEDIIHAITSLQNDARKAQEAYHHLIRLSGGEIDSEASLDWDKLQHLMGECLKSHEEATQSLEQRLHLLKKEQQEEKSTHIIGEAIKAGRLAPSLREWAISYHNRDAEGFNSFLKAHPPLLQKFSSVSSDFPSSHGANALSRAEQSICAQLKLDSERFLQAKGRLQSSGHRLSTPSKKDKENTPS